jgi:hypothetical protein
LVVPVPDEEDSIRQLEGLCSELAALNEAIPKLSEAVTSLVKLLSSKTGVFGLLKKEAGVDKEKPTDEEAEKPDAEASHELELLLPTLSEEAREWLIIRGKTLAMKHWSPDRELWNRVNDELRKLGFKWASEGKNSHWWKGAA